MKTIKIGDDPSVYATGNYNCKTSTTGTSIPKQKPKELDWEKEFDEEFKSLANEYCDPTNDVKDFISQLLKTQREEIVSEIEGKKIDLINNPNIGEEMSLNDGVIVGVSYNRAISDIIKILEKK